MKDAIRLTTGTATNRRAGFLAACCIPVTGAVVMLLPVTVQAQLYRYEELYSFRSGADGYSPQGALVEGADGDFYGTTYQGGQPTTNCPACGYGTVFRVTPGGVLTTIAWFDGTTNDYPTNYGEYPFGAMLLASEGNFYGDSQHGLFRATPGGVLTAMPGGTLGDPAQGTNGYLYSGNPNYGIVAWYSLSGSTLGSAYPSGTLSGGLIQASDGNFYGLTSDGGAYGYGTAYKLTPSGTLSTLVSFGNNCRWPYGKMLQAGDGSLYGVCHSPEQVFKLTLSGTLTTFAVFGTNGDWGYNPNGGLIQANDGNFYGTTFEGGPLAGAQGTVFKITPQAEVTTLFVFSTRGAVPGSGPMAGLIQGHDGNLYGTCAYGGTYGGGNIFRILMPGPGLGITAIGDAAVLSWRTNYQGFGLETSTTLTSGTWSAATNAPLSSNGRFWSTNSLPGDTRFFRLSK